MNIYDYWSKSARSLSQTGSYLSGDQIGEEDPNYRIICPADYGDDIEILFEATHYLDFAQDRGDLDGLTNSDGCLTTDAEKVIRTILRDQLTNEYGLSDDMAERLDVSDAGVTSDPCLQVTVYYTPGDETVKEMMEEYASPFFTMMRNITDPGTSNHIYLWPEVQSALNL